MRRSWRHWLRVCVVALTVPVLSMGPAWAGRGLLRCHRKQCQPVGCHPVVCCPVVDHTGCEVVHAEIVHGPMTIVEEVAPTGDAMPAAPESVVAKPTRPDDSTVAEAVPPLAPAAPVAPASVEAPATPEPTQEPTLDLQAELADLKTELSSDMKAELSGLKTELKAERNDLKTELKADLSTLQTELKGDLSKLKAELEAELAELKTEMKAKPEAAAPVAPPQPAPPAEDNIFTEQKGKSSYEQFQDEQPGEKPAGKQPARQDMPVEPKPSVETEPGPSSGAEPDSPFPLPEIPAPTLNEPSIPAPTTPASDDNPFSALLPEPVRRWFDDSGSHDTVGQLVEVHPDRVRIRKLNGRFTTVSISRLSAADQSYLTATAVRLAAKPRPTDTAGM